MIKSSLKFIFNYGILMLVIGVSGCGEKKTAKNITPKPPLKTESQTPELGEEVAPEPVVVTANTRETYQ